MFAGTSALIILIPMYRKQRLKKHKIIVITEKTAIFYIRIWQLSF